MEKIQCDLCSSVDLIKINDDEYQCQSCGCKYTLKQMKTKISGSVQIIKGSEELERLNKNAETLMKMSNYDDAEVSYTKMTEEFPEDYRGWWGLILAYSENFTWMPSPKLENLFDCFKHYKPFKWALQTAPDEVKEKISSEYNSYLGSVANKRNDVLKDAINLELERLNNRKQYFLDDCRRKPRFYRFPFILLMIFFIACIFGFFFWFNPEAPSFTYVRLLIYHLALIIIPIVWYKKAKAYRINKREVARRNDYNYSIIKRFDELISQYEKDSHSALRHSKDVILSCLQGDTSKYLEDKNKMELMIQRVNNKIDYSNFQW